MQHWVTGTCGKHQAVYAAWQLHLYVIHKQRTRTALQHKAAPASMPRRSDSKQSCGNCKLRGAKAVRGTI